MGENGLIAMSLESWIAFHDSPGKKTSRQPVDLFVVLDLEETSAMYGQIDPPEIIEISAVAVNATTGHIASEFHCLVKPTFNSQLSDYCISTSGVSQADVDGGQAFADAISDMDDWFRFLKVNSGEVSFSFVTCGDRDLMTLLPRVAEAYSMKLPQYFASWVNLKEGFGEGYGLKNPDLLTMLSELKMYHVGKQHGGIDSCRNVSRIVSRIIWDGKLLQLTFECGQPYRPAPKAVKPIGKLTVPQLR